LSPIGIIIKTACLLPIPARPMGGAGPQKNRCCAIRFYGYVGSMNWQPFVLLAIVLAAVVLFVWRSAGKKSGGCSGKCGCAQNHDSKAKPENAAR
jgi:hypothetical protein